MLEPLITEVANRFTLGTEETRKLYRLLVVRLGGEPRGLQALLDRADALGMEDLVESWLGPHPDEPIAPGQVDDLLGAEAIDDMAERLGITGSAVSGAISDLLPAAVRALARGSVPAAVEPTGPYRTSARYGEAIAAQEASAPANGRWALLAVAAVAIGAYWYFSRRRHATEDIPAPGR